jgi:hypothetical protein
MWLAPLEKCPFPVLPDFQVTKHGLGAGMAGMEGNICWKLEYGIPESLDMRSLAMSV